MCLQPTSPLRLASDIDAAVSLALQKNADAVVSLMPVPQHPYWMKHIDPTGHFHDFMALEVPVTRRQDLPPVYALNGAIYLAQRHVLLQRQSWYGDNTYAYVMPPERSLDIDTPWDMHVANLLLQDRCRRDSEAVCHP
jgi:CMP-N,N'-diacetyllegionaminic acid synthase